MSSNAVTIVVTLLGSGLLSTFVSGLMTKRANSIEQLKASREGGLHVTKAHYNLELESFKRVWSAGTGLDSPITLPILSSFFSFHQIAPFCFRHQLLKRSRLSLVRLELTYSLSSVIVWDFCPSAVVFSEALVEGLNLLMLTRRAPRLNIGSSAGTGVSSPSCLAISNLSFSRLRRLASRLP